MRRRKFSQCELQFIEEVAQERLKFRRIFSEQTAIFRANVPEYRKAMERFKESGKIAKRWMPPTSPAEIDEHLRKYEELCKAVPENFGDRVMIMHVAHAAILVLILCKMRLHPGEAIACAVYDRIQELKGQNPPPPVTSRDYSTPEVALGPESRVMTTDELSNFQNDPDSLLGKKFILHPNTDDEDMYEVIGYCKKRDKSIEYEVLFESIPQDPLMYEEKDMKDMLENSHYISDVQ